MVMELYEVPAEQLEQHKRLNGNFNDFPPNWKKITVEAFAKSDYFSWTPVLFEYRQMLEKSEMVEARLNWMPSGLGYAIVNDYWGGTVQFFVFGTRDPNWLKGVDSSG